MQSYKFLLPTISLMKNELPERLAYSGQRVRCSKPGAEEFYNTAQSFKPDATIIDEQITLKETLRMIENSKAGSKNSKIIVLSSSGDKVIAEYKRSGADAILPANAGATEVIFSLESLLGRKTGDISYETELYERVSDILCELSITPNYCGYRYLRDILILVVGEPDSVRQISKTIYPKVALKNHARPSCIERGVRTAISRSWSKVTTQTKVKYFGVHSTVLTKAPTNSEFIFIVAERILREIRLERKL